MLLVMQIVFVLYDFVCIGIVGDWLENVDTRGKVNTDIASYFFDSKVVNTKM